MKSTGIVRKTDALGRVVLPKELRATLGLEENAPLEIFTDGDSIILKKYRPAGACDFCGEIGEDCKPFGKVLICAACREEIAKL